VRAALLALCPLRIEARAVAGASPGTVTVLRTGAGPRRAAAAAARWSAPAGRSPAAVAVCGVAGGLDPALRPGDLVVADRVVDEGGRIVADLPTAGLVAAWMRRAGLRAVVGTVASTAGLVRGTAAREHLRASTGASAVDMESAALLSRPWPAPVAVVRAVADTPGRELVSASTVAGGIAALRALRAATPVLASWAAAAGPRTVLLAGPRSFCAGVERAVGTVERALDRYGAPVYVRRQIVHNSHVVAELEGRGAVFVQELDEVPEGATVVFSAHGVAPDVASAAAARDLRVVDATCPLVAKVHSEIRRFDRRGYDVVLVGHAGHDETEGSVGHGRAVHMVGAADEVVDLRVTDPERVAYVTQTTLSPDDTAPVVTALRRRFPDLVGPAASDICYATRNRQDAVRAVAEESDVVVVLGSANSSNAARLVEVAERAGTTAALVDDLDQLDPDWLAGSTTVGVSAAASTPAAMVDSLVAALATLGPVEVAERTVHTESISFSLPPEVR
jgi:4-hydroxy-3-methylbut-2-enyl diphosphate reductase